MLINTWCNNLLFQLAITIIYCNNMWHFLVHFLDFDILLHSLTLYSVTTSTLTMPDRKHSTFLLATFVEIWHNSETHTHGGHGYIKGLIPLLGQTELDHPSEHIGPLRPTGHRTKGRCPKQLPIRYLCTDFIFYICFHFQCITVPIYSVCMYYVKCVKWFN